MKFNIKIRDRQSGKTSKLIEKANREALKNKRVIFITVSDKSANIARNNICDIADVDIVSSTFISVDKFRNFNIYDVVILDDCLLYSKPKMNLIVGLINRTKKVKVFAMSSIK